VFYNDNGICGKLKVIPSGWDLTDPPRFTVREVEDAKVLIRAHSVWLQVASRDEGGELWLKSTKPPAGYIPINEEMFPSIKPGETVSLEEIAGGQA
jgi:hypothetical protein